MSTIDMTGESKNITPPYEMIKQFINALSDEAVEFTYLYCWVVLSERGLGQTSVVDNDLGEK